MAGAAEDVSTIRFSKKEPTESLGIRLRVSTLERIDKLTKKEGLSRNAIIEQLLNWALDEIDAERTQKK